MKPRILFLLLTAVYIFSFQGHLLAADQDDINSILGSTAHYDPTTGECTTSSEASAGGGEATENSAGASMEAINRLKPIYLEASERTGVPWQAIAAIHYRESSNDPDKDLQAGNPIGGPYGQASSSYSAFGTPTDMTQSAEFAAKELISKAAGGVVKKPVNVPNPEPAAMKDALFGYNGRASAYADQAETLGFNRETEPYEGSPYVMNMFDAKHRNMRIITRDFGGLDGTDTRLGAYTLYVALGGGSGQAGEAACETNASTAVGLEAKIKEYAWPDYHEPNYLELKPEYAAAITAAQRKGEYVGGDTRPGVDCGGFVTRVMRDSGFDPEYNKHQGNTTQQQKYLDEQVGTGKYVKLTGITGTEKLQLGDVAINDHHTYMFVGKLTKFNGNSASASFSDRNTSWRTPMASGAYGFETFSWYRKVK